MNRGGPRVVFYILCSLVSQLVSGSRWYFLFISSPNIGLFYASL